MSVGFRKCFFGFHCDDVMEYIEKNQHDAAAREIELNERIQQSETELSDVRGRLDSLMIENNRLNGELKQFTEKYDDIQRLSENIGKLYLVARANAQAIANNSLDSARTIDSQVQSSLEAIDNAQESFDELKQNIMQTSSQFAKEIDALMLSLSDSKDRILSNGVKTQVAQDEIMELCGGVSGK